MERLYTSLVGWEPTTGWGIFRWHPSQYVLPICVILLLGIILGIILGRRRGHHAHTQASSGIPLPQTWSFIRTHPNGAKDVFTAGVQRTKMTARGVRVSIPTAKHTISPTNQINQTVETCALAEAGGQ
jgi:hypothetical protein